MRLIAFALLTTLLNAGCCPDCPECEQADIDADGDGYTPNQGDCDDSDETVFPRAEEICGDEVDQDCSDDPDDGTLDADGDGHMDLLCTDGTDCDDADPDVNPDAFDGCDGLDNDCDAAVDEDTIVVDWSGGGDTETIQEAVDAAASGDVVCVLSGSYTENLVLDAGELSLVGLAGAEETIIDGGGSGSALVFQYGDSSTVQGFTLTGGAGTLFDPDNDGALDACGGGVFVDASTASLVDVIITGNAADDGGGLYVNNASLLLSDSQVSDNQAGRYGGGVRLRHAEDVQLESVQVSTNTSVTGGGFSLYDSELVLIDGTISANLAESNGGGLYVGTDSTVELSAGSITGNSAGALGGGIRAYGSQLIAAATDISSNTAVDAGGGVACRKADMSVTADVHDNDPDDVYCDECTGCTDAP